MKNKHISFSFFSFIFFRFIEKTAEDYEIDSEQPYNIITHVYPFSFIANFKI